MKYSSFKIYFGICFVLRIEWNKQISVINTCVDKEAGATVFSSGRD